MKIGIDVREAADPKNGKGVYAWNLIKELLKLDRENKYCLYTNRIMANFAAFQNAEIRIIAKPNLLWHFAVIRDFVKSGGELFFAPTSFIIPAFLPKKIRSIMTVHDLVAFLHPHLHHTKSMILEHLFFRRALKKTSRVLVPSENTKKDLMRIFRYPEEKITVTPLGVDAKRKDTNPVFDKRGSGFASPSEKRKGARASSVARPNVSGGNVVSHGMSLPEEYILTVAGLEPRKNVEMLVDVVLRENDIKLVIVGGKGWKSNRVQKKIRQAGGRIIHLENVAAEELPEIYSRAKVFVYPSFYEGFGLPPLEAMAQGCPVICSNAASMPEICGDAALYFDPKNPKELAGTLKRALKDERLRTELSGKSREQAVKFSWQRTAELTLSAFA